MTTEQFLHQLDQRIARYDLLRHPFYQAWGQGELSHEDLRQYARDYYHHVKAFPSYLAALSMRLEDGDLRRAVLANLADEKGWHEGGVEEREHAELWLDFAEGIGGRRDVRGSEPPREIRDLMSLFHTLAADGSPEQALAAFYAYESQVPRVATEKTRGLREMYGADEKTCSYFTLHATADLHHSRVWRDQLSARVQADPGSSEEALAAAESAAKALWKVLDGFEARRTAQAA